MFPHPLHVCLYVVYVHSLLKSTVQGWVSCCTCMNLPFRGDTPQSPLSPGQGPVLSCPSAPRPHSNTNKLPGSHKVPLSQRNLRGKNTAQCFLATSCLLTNFSELNRAWKTKIPTRYIWCWLCNEWAILSLEKLNLFYCTIIISDKMGRERAAQKKIIAVTCTLDSWLELNPSLSLDCSSIFYCLV